MLSKVKFANSDIEVTRLISGGNPLCGNSHYNKTMDAEMADYFTDKQVVAYLHDLEKKGINTLQARGDYHRIIYWRELFHRENGQLNWIAQTASEMSCLTQNINIIAAAGAAGIYHHGTRTDNLWLDGKIDTVQEQLKAIRDTGCQVGLGTHNPEVIEYAEEKGWDIDFYMACFYNISREKRQSALVDKKSSDANEENFDHDDRAVMCKTICSTDKMCLAFKILGASRLCENQEQVAEAFKFAFDNIKSKDAVVVGMFPRDFNQIEANIQYACRGMGL
ncbi:MAG: hypothetical protein ACYTFY_05525 [Planctomycetota bacterium]|jgi:hypothetical protein